MNSVSTATNSSCAIRAQKSVRRALSLIKGMAPDIHEPAARQQAPAAEVNGGAGAGSRLELRRQSGGGVLAGHDRDDLERGEVAPFRDPALEQRDVLGFHELGRG